MGNSKLAGYNFTFILALMLALFVASACDRGGTASTASGVGETVGVAQTGDAVNEQPVLIRVPAEEANSIVARVREFSGVWSIQRHGKDLILFRAPLPFTPQLSAFINSFENWIAPISESEINSAAPIDGLIFRTFNTQLNVDFDEMRNQTVENPPPLLNDAREPLPDPSPPAGLSPQSYATGNYRYKTDEYFIGSIAVGLILPESNGNIDADTETWTDAEVSNIYNQAVQALTWAQDGCRACDITYQLVLFENRAGGGVAGTCDTDYEAINNNSDSAVVDLDILAGLGFTANPADRWETLHDVTDWLRTNYNTDWAVAFKVGRDRNDADNAWPDGGYAWAYLGGPWGVMTYENNGWPQDIWYKVFAHELDHVFNARDEYLGAGQSPTGRAGHYQVLTAGSCENDGTGYYTGAGECNPASIQVQTDPDYLYFPHIQGQIGWWDDNGNAVPDATERAPTLTMTPSCSTNLQVTGQATVNLLGSALYGTVSWIGLGTITGVEYRINQLTWIDATPDDGTFDTGGEAYTGTLALPDGTYYVEARAVSSYGVPTSWTPLGSCTVSGSPTTNAAPFAYFSSSRDDGGTNTVITLDASDSADLETQKHDLLVHWDLDGDLIYDTAWSTDKTLDKVWTSAGTKDVTVQVKDADGNMATYTKSIEIVASTNLAPELVLAVDQQMKVGSASPTFWFNVTDSSDPEGTALQVRWDYTNDGSWDTSFSTTLTQGVIYTVSSYGSSAWQLKAEITDGVNSVIGYISVRAISYDSAPSASWSSSYMGGGQWDFDGSASSDADSATSWDGIVEYRWDYNGDGDFDSIYTSSSAGSYTYDRLGTFPVKLEVRDGFRALATASANISYTISAPDNLQINPCTSVYAPTLMWNSKSGMVEYSIEVSTTTDFTSPLLELRSTTNSVQLPELDPGTTYYWRVAGHSSSYNFTLTNWSTTESFTVGGIFVDGTSGSNGNPGTMGAPLKNLQYGIDTAAPSGVPVYVAGGTYSQTAWVKTSLCCSYDPTGWTYDPSGNMTTINANQTFHGAYVVEGADATINGCTINGGDATYARTIGLRVAGKALLVDNTISGGAGTSLTYGVLAGGTACSAAAVNNIIHGGTSAGNSSGWVTANCDVGLVNNTVVSDGGAVHSIAYNSWAAADGSFLVNNIFDGGDTAAENWALAVDSPSMLDLNNNLLVGSTTGSDARLAVRDGAITRYNDAADINNCGTIGATCASSTGNIVSTTAGFVGGGDYSLSNDSPAINLGLSADSTEGLLPASIDIDGNPRGVGEGWDIGAREKQTGLLDFDFFATPVVISDTSITHIRSNVNATMEAGEIRHPPGGYNSGASVWFNWTAPADGTISLDTLACTWDTQLAVYTGSAVDSLVLIGSNDDQDYAGGVFQSEIVALPVTNGQLYRIVVAGYQPATGDPKWGRLELNFSYSP